MQIAQLQGQFGILDRIQVPNGEVLVVFNPTLHLKAPVIPQLEFKTTEIDFIKQFYPKDPSNAHQWFKSK